MNDDVPPQVALLIGAVIGVLLYGPIRRWVVTLIRTLRERSAKGEDRRAGSTSLLLIFATLHPAPWLILFGLPYGVYRLWSDPLRLIWGCLLAGSILGTLAMVAFSAWGRARGRPARE